MVNHKNPIRVACDYTFNARWAFLRSAPRQKTVLKDFCRYFTKIEPRSCLNDITQADLAKYLAYRTAKGDAASTIVVRRGVIRAVFEEQGLDVPRVKGPRVIKREQWWLSSKQRRPIIRAIRHGLGDKDLADLIEVISETGIRIEEALRLEVKHLDYADLTLMVPGTKTAASLAPIPVSRRAAAIIQRRAQAVDAEGGLLFKRDGLDFDGLYHFYKKAWRHARRALGLPKEATLRGFRRSFAGDMHQRQMPTELLRRLLRHTRIETTAGYLRLTGLPLDQARVFLEAAE